MSFRACTGRHRRAATKLVLVVEGDPLEALSRQGAQRMLSAALEKEVAEYLERQRYRSCYRRPFY